MLLLFQGMMCTLKVLMLELFPKETRSYVEAITFLAWSMGIMVIALFGYAFRDVDWRYLQIGLAAVSVYALVEWWYVSYRCLKVWAVSMTRYCVHEQAQ